MTSRCPFCGTVLHGGPVAFWCGVCGRQITAADVEHEHTLLTATGRLS